ncbi:hypothetical protein MTO96_020910 [Rhipicephalus appendiculatus]
MGSLHSSCTCTAIHPGWWQEAGHWIGAGGGTAGSWAMSLAANWSASCSARSAAWMVRWTAKDSTWLKARGTISRHFSRRQARVPSRDRSMETQTLTQPWFLRLFAWRLQTASTFRNTVQSSGAR